MNDTPLIQQYMHEWETSMRHFINTAIILLFATLPAHAQNVQRVDDGNPKGKIYVYKEVDGVNREIEIYFPKGHDASENTVAGIILFHGGGWGGGSRKAFSYQCNYFASRGMVAATVTYRLRTKADRAAMKDGQSTKRVCIPDVKSAIRWFKQHAKELGVDPNRIVAGGGSAGGHISLLGTTNPGLNDPNDPQGIDTSVAAYVLFNPALSKSDAKDPDVDFLRHLKADFGPAIVFFGSEDRWLKNGWTPAAGKMKSLGITSVDLRIAEGETHAFFNKQPWKDVTLIAADQFLIRLGYLKGKPTLSMPKSGETLSKRRLFATVPATAQNKNRPQPNVSAETLALYETGKFKGVQYRLMKPIDFDPSKTYPLILSLHGGSGRGTKNIKNLLIWNEYLADEDLRRKHPAFVLAPQSNGRWLDNTSKVKIYPEPGSITIDDLPKAMRKFGPQMIERIEEAGRAEPVYGVLDEVFELIDTKLSKQYKIDADRVYVLGHSMGGLGTFAAVYQHPDRFAAAIPSAGAFYPWLDAKRIQDVPLWIFHGKPDKVVDYLGSRHVFDRLSKLNANAKFTTLKGVGHGSKNSPAFRYTGDDPEKGYITEYASDRCDKTDHVWDWLFRQKR